MGRPHIVNYLLSNQQQILVNKTIRDNLSYSHQIPDERHDDTLQKNQLSDGFHSGTY